MRGRTAAVVIAVSMVPLAIIGVGMTFFGIEPMSPSWVVGLTYLLAVVFGIDVAVNMWRRG